MIKIWHTIWIDLAETEIKIYLVEEKKLKNILKNQVNRNKELTNGEVMFVPRKGVFAFHTPFLDPKEATELIT
jgi:hypothetical protein